MEATVDYQYFYTREEIICSDGKHRIKKEPRVTVCYVRTPERVGVGIAICSRDDNPDKLTGCWIARRRALRALKERHVDTLERPAAFSMLCASDMLIPYIVHTNHVKAWYIAQPDFCMRRKQA
jgi:hypothetical protein